MMQDKRKQTKIDRRKLKQFTPLWRELLMVCGNDKDQALIVATLEYFIDTSVKRFMKRNNIDNIDLVDDQQFIVPMSRADLRGHDIKDHAFLVAVAKLIERDFVEAFMERSKPNGPYYYTLNYGAIEAAITTVIDRQGLASDDWAPPEFSSDATKDLVRVDDLADRFARKHRKREKPRTASFCMKTTSGRVAVASDFNAQEILNQHTPENRCGKFTTATVVNLPQRGGKITTEGWWNYHSDCGKFTTQAPSVSCAEASQFNGAQGDINDKDTATQLALPFMHLDGAEKAEKALGRSSRIYITIEPQKQNKNTTNTTNPQTQLDAQHCATSNHQHQPTATPMAAADDVHPQTQPAASSSDEANDLYGTEQQKQKRPTGEDSNPDPISTPRGNFLFSSEVAEKTTSKDDTEETDTPSEDPKNSWRPDAPRENELRRDAAAPENKSESTVTGGSGGLKEPIGFCMDPVDVAPRVAGEDEGSEPVTSGARPRKAKKEVYFDRDWLGYRDDDPDVGDPSLKDQKGKGRRPEEPKKKRCPAFRATRKPMASADIWVEIIRERYNFGEYPKSITPEIIDLAEYWIRGLYKSELRVAAELDMMDGYPQVIAKVLDVHGKTPRQFRAVSDYIRSTAGSPEFDWSCRILSPEALNQRTRTNNRVYINHLLDMIERGGGSGASVARGGQMNQPQQEVTLGYEGMGRERKLQDLKARMSKAHSAGFWMYLNINRMHSNGDVRGLEDIVPQDMWHFVEEYREITGWKKEVA